MLINCKECESEVELKLKAPWTFELKKQEGAKVKMKEAIFEGYAVQRCYKSKPLRDVKYLKGICEECGEENKYRTDFLQPCHEEFKRVFGDDPFAATKNKEKELAEKESKRKDDLQRKYNAMFKGRKIHKELENEVLHNRGPVSEHLKVLKEANKCQKK